MDDNIKKRLNSESSVNDVNGNVFTSISVNQTQKELPLDPINVVVSESDVFNVEREESKIYRFITTINANVHNTLFDTSNWRILDSKARYVIEEYNGWFGYKTTEVVSGSDKTWTFYDLTPKREQLFYLNNLGQSNWVTKITRPVRKVIPSNSVVDGGLLIIDGTTQIVGGRTILLLTVPVKHNLVLGSLVNISGFSSQAFDKQYKVLKLGDVVGDNSEYIFGIDASSVPPVISFNTRMKRVVGGKESEYYFREFEVIDDNLYSDEYLLPMAKQSYGDKIYQIAFDDVNLSGLTDHLNRPVTEVFMTITKTSNGDFTDIKSGLDIPYFSVMDNGLTTIPDIHRITESPTTNTPLESQITSSTTTYLGDVVDYNEYDVNEVVLSDVNHCFNTNGRLTNDVDFGNRYEEYYYKPHHRVKLRDFSNYIEQGDSSTDGIPSYAVDLGDGRFLWRDILSVGVNNGQDTTLDYPFTNGCHYLYDTIYLNLSRQDPFAKYGSYYGIEPADPIGIIFETTDIETKDDNTNC